MDINKYEIEVCHNCETEPLCQHSNIEDCMRRDEETYEDELAETICQALEE